MTGPDPLSVPGGVIDWESVLNPDPSGHYTEFQTEGRSIAEMMAIPPERREQVPAHGLPDALVGQAIELTGHAAR